MQLGSSANDADYVFKNVVSQLNPKTVVDFGCGGGKIGKLVRECSEIATTIGVDGFKPAVEEAEKSGYYEKCVHGLIQNWIYSTTEKYDLGIFGDVLEHLNPREIHKVVKKSTGIFKHIIIIAPLHECLQGVCYDNELEIHKTYITENFFDRYHPVQKFISRNGYWKPMFVLIDCGDNRISLVRRFKHTVFHNVVKSFQVFGSPRPVAVSLMWLSSRVQSLLNH